MQISVIFMGCNKEKLQEFINAMIISTFIRQKEERGMQ